MTIACFPLNWFMTVLYSALPFHLVIFALGKCNIGLVWANQADVSIKVVGRQKALDRLKEIEIYIVANNLTQTFNFTENIFLGFKIQIDSIYY